MSDQEENGDSGEEESLAQRRGRRSRGDKTGRLAALEKLKSLRGTKNKYEVKEVDNVYDVVDENTYIKKVNDRIEDDWIVDDGSGAYFDTGEELFDDDGEDRDTASRRKGRSSVPLKKAKVSKEEKASQRAGFLSVRDMLTNMPVKRKRPEAAESSTSAGGENDLDDLLQELHEEKKPRTSLPSGLKLLERTKATEKLLSAAKISEDNPFAQQSPKITIKKKLPVYKVNNNPPPQQQVKEEPIEIDDFSQDDGFDSGEHYQIDDYSEDPNFNKKSEALDVKTKTETTSTNAAKTIEVKKEPAVPSIKKEPFLQLQEVENFENFRQTTITEEKIVVEDQTENMDFMTDGHSDQNKMLNFYWFDIYEEPRNPGYLYLFGKVKNANNQNDYSSCCIILKNVQRCMYLLPKEKLDDGTEVKFVDLYNEFTENTANKFKIGTFRTKETVKKYCFGKENENIPSPSDYLEVRYSGALPPLPEDLQGKYFSRVFGTNSSLLENFLLEKKLRGPCWMQISNPEQVEPGQQQSWCKLEFTCEVNRVKIHPEKDSMSVPPFVIASLNISSFNDPNTKKDTIVSACVAINKSFDIQKSIPTDKGFFHDSFCLINKPPGEVWPFDLDRALSKFTTKMDSERSMLACLLAKLAQFDPDVYVGHDLNLDLLLLQLWNHKVPHWSRIGRLKRSSQPQKGGKMPDSKSAIAGRLACDVKISAMELIRARSYDLPSLSVQVLGMAEDAVIAYNGAELRQLFETSEGIKHLTNWGMSLSLLNLRLVNELQVMPLALQITCIAGNTLARTLMGGRSERNEFLLLHAFYNKDYIVPDKQKYGKRFKREDDDDEGDKKKGKSSGPSYAGGLVLDPKKGFYDNFIVLMDFNSLYPSIIQEFNICFTTSTTETETDDTEKGILPDEIRKLVESRRQVKKLMQADNVSQDLKRQYDIRQKALKLTANSMYGCLGFRNSRFYAQHLAALITGKGRDILLKTKDAVEKMGFEVIYGDTDSLMINTNTQEVQKVYQIGNKIKAEVNRTYKLLELEIDGVYRFLLLLKKKKYAALTYAVKSNGEIETAMELKGLDIVRRDWAPVAATTARSILDQIMTEQPLDDKIFKVVKILSDKAEELRAGTVPMKDLLITKQLAKNPEEYKGSQGLYHVVVALRINQNGRLPKKFRNGDTVPYLFCTDGLPHHPVELMQSKVKAKPEEVAKTDGENGDTVVEVKEADLEPDAAYYLSQQVHPVVTRICEPIPGLDAARIAEALGLDPSSYKRRRVVDNNDDDRALGEISEAEKYRHCERFSFRCATDECKREIVMDSPFVQVDGKWICILNKCPGCSLSPLTYMDHIYNTLVLFMRKFVEKYYKGWYICEDPACTYRERAVSLKLEKGYLVCACKQGVMMREYTDSDLHLQFNYLLYVFDFVKQQEEHNSSGNAKVELDGDKAKLGFARLSNAVNQKLKQSSYSEIRLCELFSELMPKQFEFGRPTVPKTEYPGRNE